jgi:hypothetical protein
VVGGKWHKATYRHHDLHAVKHGNSDAIINPKGEDQKDHCSKNDEAVLKCESFIVIFDGVRSC